MGTLGVHLGTLGEHDRGMYHCACTPRVLHVYTHCCLYIWRYPTWGARTVASVMRESLSEELRAEVRTRNLRRVVLLGVTFGTRGRFGYGVRVAFCSGSL